MSPQTIAEKEAIDRANNPIHNPTKRRELFDARLAAYHDELKWLYTELYGQTACFDQLKEMAYHFAMARKPELVALDIQREQQPDWYRRCDMAGMMMYTEQFAGTLKGIEAKIPYLRKLRLKYLHLMPLLKMPKEQNDGGYAVSDFRQVDERLGSMDELSHLADVCRKEGMSICLDFIVNHTSDEHEWACRAKQGDPEYQARYMCYDTYDIPAQYEATTPQVFPNTAPGNFIFEQQMNKWVLSTFNPYQWDLNYKNPVVFNEMAGNLLFLANVGIEIFRIDAVPYIWKQLGTNSRNLPQVHTIMRMLRMLAKIVCPAVVFKGEVVMAPKEVAPYFGPVDKPECDILYNVTTMVCVWNSLATRDVSLLRHQMDELDQLPREYTFVNYVRCHDDIGWGLDEAQIQAQGQDPLAHKKFLYHFYIGDYPDSFARGELYNYDPVTEDARSCGTCASLCGIEKALDEHDEEAVALAVQRHIMIHAYIASLGGIPVIYSGDELAQRNDNAYHDDPVRAVDSRFIHRGKFDWEAAAQISDPSTLPGYVFTTLQRLLQVRGEHIVFDAGAQERTLESFDKSVLAFRRWYNTPQSSQTPPQSETLIALYNFSEQRKHLPMYFDGTYTDLLTGQTVSGIGVDLIPYGFLWLRKD